MKSIILVVLLLVSLVASQPQCDTYSCIPEGGKCNNDYYSNNALLFPTNNRNGDNQVSYCGSGFYCNYALDPNADDGVCSKLGSEGELCPNYYACDGSNTCINLGDVNGCEIGLTCYQSNGPATCQNLQYAILGADCDTDLQCVQGLICDLDENVCAVNTTNFDSGDVCTQNVHCPAAQYCNGGECKAAHAVGDTCTSDYQCTQNAVCDLGTCRKIFSRTESQSCSNPLVCAIGSNLYCDGTCTKIPSLVSGNCSDTVACDYSSSCKCGSGSVQNQYTGSCTQTFFTKPAACQASMSAFFQCLVDNGCPSVTTGDLAFQSSESCAFDKCSSEYCDSLSNCQSNLTGACNTDVLSSTVCTSASSILSASIAIIILALFVILF